MIYAESDIENIDMDLKIKELNSKGYKDKDVSIILSNLYGYNNNEDYKRSLELS